MFILACQFCTRKLLFRDYSKSRFIYFSTKRKLIREKKSFQKPYKYNSDLFDAELTDEDEPKAEVGERFSPTRPQYSDDENEGSGANSKKKKVRVAYGISRFEKMSHNPSCHILKDIASRGRSYSLLYVILVNA